MIEHVNQGEKITALKQNQIIDAANGQNIPSGNFVNTGKGTIFPSSASKETFNPSLIPPTVFQTKWCNTFEMTSRSDNGHDEYNTDSIKRSWYVYLGPDADELKTYVKRLFNISQSFKLYIVPKDNDNKIEVTTSLLSAWSTGYVDISSYDSKKVMMLYVKTWYQSDSSSPEMYPHFSVVITDADSDSAIASKLYDLIQETEGQDQNRSKLVDSCLIAKRNDKDKTFQYQLCPKSQMTDGILTDSEISAAMLSSLQPYEYYDEQTSSYITGYEIYKFHDLSNTLTVSQSELSGYDVIARRQTDGDKPAEVVYLSLSGLSGGGGEVISGDADVLENQRSISLEDNENGKYYQLYGFENGYGGSYYADLDDWTEDGDELTCWANVYRGDDNGTFVMRYTDQNGDNPEIEYGDLQMVARIPNVSAMIRGDSDVIPGTQNSILKKIDSTSGKVYLQMYNFDNPSKQEAVKIDLEYDQYKDWSDTKPTVDLVTRNRTTGKIEYRNLQIKVPEDSAHKDQLDRHEDDINELQTNVIDLSSQISSLETDYWEKGGSETDNYGSGIGNDNQVKVIDLNGQCLQIGNQVALDWERRQMYDNASVISYDWSNRLMYDAYGNPVVNVGGYNLADTTSKKSVAWKDRQLWDGDLHQVAEWNNNEFKINNRLKIGNTTLTETQLQQLLALLNSSNNVLNQSF